MGLQNKVILFLSKSICWLVILLPFSIAIETGPLNVVWAMALVFFIIKSIILGPKPLLPNPLNRFFLLFMIASSFSLLNSHSSHRGIEIGIRNLFLLFRYWLLMSVIREEIRDKPLLKKILLAMFFGALLSSIDSFWQVIFGKDFIRGASPIINLGLRRATASFDNANVLGVYLAPIFVVTAGLARYFFAKKEKIYMLILTTTILGGVLLTYSRPAILACFVGLFFMACVKQDKLLIIIFLLIIVLFPFILPKSVKDYARSVNYNPIVFMCNTDRIGIYKNAINMIKHHPIIGVGLGTFSDNYLKYKLPEPDNCRTGEHMYAHNIFLQMAGETGALGLGGFVILLIKIFQAAFRNYKLIEDKFYKILSLSLIGSLIAFLINGMTETSLYYKRVAVIFWFLVGLVLAIAKNIRAEDSSK